MLEKICISQAQLSKGVVCVRYFGKKFVVLGLGRKKTKKPDTPTPPPVLSPW